MEQQQPHSMKCPSCARQQPAGTAFCPWDGHSLVPASPPEARTDPLLGSRVSEYVIQERIGAGGMGVVYRAVQPLIGKQVAVKVLKADIAKAQELVQRLLVEARVVNAIQHRGVIDIFGFGQLPDGRPYVVMELLQGVSLSAFIRRRKKLPAMEAVAILDEMLAALGAAHRGGVIHRDLKPGNVFLVENAEGVRSLKLLDFGIAKVVASQPSDALTRVGSLLGTPEYMAPEQIRGEQVSPATDLYSVGVIAFQMLTGRLPFRGEQMSVLLAQVEAKPPALSSLAPDVPKVLESIVMRLLAKSPAKRYASAEAVRSELSVLLPSRPAESQESSSPSIVSQRQPRTNGPALAAAVEMEPGTGEPSTEVLHVLKPAKPWWLVGVAATALVASAGVVGFKVLHHPPPAPQLAAPVPQGVAAPAPAPQEPSPPVPPPPEPSSPPAQAAVEPAATPSQEAPKLQLVETPRPPPEPSPEPKPVEPPKHLKVETAARTVSSSSPSPGAPVPRKTAARVASAKAGSPAPLKAAPSASHPSIDQPTLLARLLDSEERLLKINPTACPVTSPAMARLRELQKQARTAGTNEERMKVAGFLADWEQRFMKHP